MNEESQRLDEDESRKKNWKRWGPYLSERQWATVREDYSEQGDTWSYFPHDHARSRTYRWGEDGLLGITDRECRLCFALALWNGQDAILKERLFGLTGPEGNHGEDCKECYYYLDSSPTHSYLKALYKYPQVTFPYDQLVQENRRRGLKLPEYELIDTEVFAKNRYFDVLAEYAKQTPNDVHVRITVANRASESASIVVLPGIFDLRQSETDSFYSQLTGVLDKESAIIFRQAAAGLLWSKQFYHYIVKDWLKGDAFEVPPPASRWLGRNHDWLQVYSRDVISMPDKWEYPWFAAWDLAFHMLPFAHLDPKFAKQQLELFLREWYMHPNGQIPAYEFAFTDVNPPVHAWAAWRVYKISGSRGTRDIDFLESVFHKLLLNFTWWVNRKDTEGNNIFSGGFLGLDNIGVFDRSKPLPTGGYLQQADGTAWMGFYCLTMLSIALELAQTRPVYEDMASKFFEHFVAICESVNTLGGYGSGTKKMGFITIN